MLFIKKQGPAEDLSFRATALYLGLVILAVFLPRLPHIDSRLYSVDEAIFAVIGNAIADGGIPYRDAADHKPPILFYLLGYLFRLFGHDHKIVMHAALTAVVALTAVAVYAVAAEAMNRKAGVFAALLFSIASFNQIPEDAFSFQTEWLMMFFVTAGFALALRWQRLGRRRDAFLTGLAFGLAVFSKQPALLHMAVVFLYMLLSAVFARDALRRRMSDMAVFMGGFAAVALVFFVYFTAKGMFAEFRYFCWDYNVMYASVIPFKEKIQRASASVFGDGALLPHNPLIFIPTVAFIAFPAPSVFFGREPARKKSYILVFLWALTSFAGIYLSGTGYFYYFIQILPAFSVASGFFFSKAADAAQSRLGGARARSAVFAAMFAAAAFFYPVLYAVNGQAKAAFNWKTLPWFTVPDRLTRMPDFATRVDNRELADYLHANTTAEDRIFVWGFLPHIYLESERRPATRFIICNFLVGMVLPHRSSPDFILPGAWDILMKELQLSRPKFFVDSSIAGHYAFDQHKTERYPQLDRWLKENYEEDRVIDMINSPSFVVWRRKDSRRGTAAAGTEGPSAAWTFDENAYDPAGSDATMVGVLLAPGRSGNAASFDGMNDHVRLPATLRTGRGFSALFWAKPTAVKSWARFFELGTLAGGEVYLSRRETSDDLYLDTVSGNRSLGALKAPHAITPGEWQHYAVTVDAEGGATLYKNAVPIAEGRLGAPPAGPVAGLIGRGALPDETYAGLIDEFYFFERPLGQREVSAWMNGRPKKGRP